MGDEADEEVYVPGRRMLDFDKKEEGDPVGIFNRSLINLRTGNYDGEMLGELCRLFEHHPLRGPAVDATTVVGLICRNQISKAYDLFTIQKQNRNLRDLFELDPQEGCTVIEALVDSKRAFWSPNVRQFFFEMAQVARDQGRLTELINRQQDDGSTMLHRVLGVGDLCHAAMCSLLTLGADVNMQRNDGATPLLVALHTGQFSSVAHLLAMGANPTLGEIEIDGRVEYASTIASRLLSRLDADSSEKMNLATALTLEDLMLRNLNVQRPHDGFCPLMVVFAELKGRTACVLKQATPICPILGEDGFDFGLVSKSGRDLIDMFPDYLASLADGEVKEVIASIFERAVNRWKGKCAAVREILVYSLGSTADRPIATLIMQFYTSRKFSG